MLTEELFEFLNRILKKGWYFTMIKKHKKNISTGNNFNIIAINDETQKNVVSFDNGKDEQYVIENNFELTPKPKKLLPRRSEISIQQVNDSHENNSISVVKNGSESQTVDDFDVEMYSSVEVDEDLFDQLIKSAVDSKGVDGKGKDIIVPVIKAKSSYAMNTNGRVFKWLCSGFTILKKVKDTNGQVYVDIQVSDDLSTSNIRVSIDTFSKLNLKELNKYNIHVNSGDELTASIYFQKVLDKMPMESAQQQLGFRYNEGKLQFIGYKYGLLTTNNTYDTDKEYIKNLNNLISDSVPIQYLISASMSATLMSVLKMKYNINLHSYIINVVGDSSTGKTITSRLCASMWSNPSSDTVFTAMLSTNNAMYKKISGRFGVPMFLDEATVTGNVKTDEFGYTIYEEMEKRRLNPNCTEKTSGTWNTVIVMSSEEHFHSNNKSQNGGLVVRIHNAENLTFTNSRKHADEINEFISCNYGVVGKIFVKYLFKIDILKKAYETAKFEMRDLTENSHNAYTDRLVDTYALTYLTAKILCKLGLEIDCDGVADIMAEQNQVISTEYNIAENALNAIAAYVAGHDNNTGIECRCVSNNEEAAITSVAITESLTARILADAGFKDLKTTIKALDEAGYLIRQGKNNGLKSKLHINRVPTVCYQFRFVKDILRRPEHKIRQKSYATYFNV